MTALLPCLALAVLTQAGPPQPPQLSPGVTPRPMRPLNGLAEVRGQDVVYLQQFEKGQTLFTEVEGFGAGPGDYDFRLENRKTGAGVRIRGTRPLEKLYFWSAQKTVCPEPYIDVSVAPGKESTWRITYEFYRAPEP